MHTYACTYAYTYAYTYVYAYTGRSLEAAWILGNGAGPLLHLDLGGGLRVVG